MRLKSVLATACAVALLAGCASGARSIAPVSISASEYSGLSCQETRTQLEQARAREVALARQQDGAAVLDAVGVFFILVPVGSVFGGNVAGELAQAKGESQALERALPQHCAPPVGSPTTAAPMAGEAPVQALPPSQ